MGPHKDLITPMVKACRKYGLKFGFYFSVEEWGYPIIDSTGQLKIRRWEGDSAPKIIPYSKEYESKLSGKIAVRNFATDYLVPQATEFIDKYDPDIIWYDGGWSTPAKQLHTMDITAYFYNHAAGRKEVAVNDRFGLINGKRSRFHIGDFYTAELNLNLKGGLKNLYPWEECRGISNSFGFDWQDTKKNVLSSQEFIKTFLNIVSHGGNLLLIVNLDGQGALPKYEKDRLEDIGKWLKVNGDAIYGTRAYTTPVENNIYYTRSKDNKTVFAISMGWPGNQLTLNTVEPKTGTKIYLLGYKEPLSWAYNNGETIIDLPTELQKGSKRPCKYAYAFKIKQE
ncbi:MAG: alpha-L-fucosidase, partial [Chitinophagaceae bacterium]